MEWIGPVAEYGAEMDNNPYSKFYVRTPNPAERKDSYLLDLTLVELFVYNAG